MSPCCPSPPSPLRSILSTMHSYAICHVLPCSAPPSSLGAVAARGPSRSLACRVPGQPPQLGRMSRRVEPASGKLRARQKHRVLLHEALTRVSLLNLREASRGWKYSEILKIVKDSVAVYQSRFQLRIRTRRFGICPKRSGFQGPRVLPSIPPSLRTARMLYHSYRRLGHVPWEVVADGPEEAMHADDGA
eukprot:9466777-Pyramimonas_sp.AAC.2